MVMMPGNKKTRAPGIPVIDFSLDRSLVSKLIVRACQEVGFFQVDNHGISREIISNLESEAHGFFSKPASHKQRARPDGPTPFGYGCKNIGPNGDKGELEYILMEANSHSVSQTSKSISNDPTHFSCAVIDYIDAVRNLTCEILEMVAEGMWAQDTCIFSNLIRHPDSDSCFRINHYPWSSRKQQTNCAGEQRIGFGEHTDPQILTVLRSNDVGGLQIMSPDGLWIPIPEDSDKLCVFVGDAFEALTNGRFASVRHRAMANSVRSRMSMMYFAAPPLNAHITAIPQLVSAANPCIYRAFTWGEYKAAAYSLKLADNRLDYFKNYSN